MALAQLLSRIHVLQTGANVKRWHTKALIGEQNLGHHSFGALSLLLLLHPAPTMTLVKAVLWHDMAEQYVGDVPSPTLWRNPSFREQYEDIENAFLERMLNIHMENLDPLEVTWLKAVDKLECLLFSREQLRLGNLAFKRTMLVIYQWFDEQESMPQVVSQLVRKIQESDIEDDITAVMKREHAAE